MHFLFGHPKSCNSGLAQPSVNSDDRSGPLPPAAAAAHILKMLNAVWEISETA